MVNSLLNCCINFVNKNSDKYDLTNLPDELFEQIKPSGNNRLQFLENYPLRITKWDVSKDEVSALNRCTNLWKLTIDLIEEHDVREYLPKEILNKITELVLMNYIRNKKIPLTLPVMRNLETFYIRYPWEEITNLIEFIKSSAIKNLCILTKLNTYETQKILETKNFRELKIHLEEGATLPQEIRQPELTELTIESTNRIPVDSLSTCTNLVSLCLLNCNLTNLSPFTKLEKLTISTPEHPEHMKPLFLSLNESSVKHLRLYEVNGDLLTEDMLSNLQKIETLVIEIINNPESFFRNICMLAKLFALRVYINQDFNFSILNENKTIITPHVLSIECQNLTQHHDFNLLSKAPYLKMLQITILNEDPIYKAIAQRYKPQGIQVTNRYSEEISQYFS